MSYARPYVLHFGHVPYPTVWEKGKKSTLKTQQAETERDLQKGSVLPTTPSVRLCRLGQPSVGLPVEQVAANVC